MADVRDKLGYLEALVRQNVSDGPNMDGFLLGKLNEYAVILDAESFDLRVDLDMELWEA